MTVDSGAATNLFPSELDHLCINTIRFLSVDAVQKADSGHPGLPMGAAPAAYVLWTRFLKHNPAGPNWFDRDRFILSAGSRPELRQRRVRWDRDLPMVWAWPWRKRIWPPATTARASRSSITLPTQLSAMGI